MSNEDPILTEKLVAPRQNLAYAQSNLEAAETAYDNNQKKYIEYRDFKSDLDAIASRLKNAMYYLETALENKKAGYSSEVKGNVKWMPGTGTAIVYSDEIEYLYKYTESAKKKIEEASEEAEKRKESYQSGVEGAKSRIDEYKSDIEYWNGEITRIKREHYSY